MLRTAMNSSLASGSPSINAKVEASAGCAAAPAAPGCSCACAAPSRCGFAHCRLPASAAHCSSACLCGCALVPSSTRCRCSKRPGQYKCTAAIDFRRSPAPFAAAAPAASVPAPLAAGLPSLAAASADRACGDPPDAASRCCDCFTAQTLQRLTLGYYRVLCAMLANSQTAPCALPLCIERILRSSRDVDDGSSCAC